MTRQLQAMVELEAIPDHYKIARSRPRWLLRLLLILACVAGGVGIGVVLFASGESERPVMVEINSVPEGATVSIDGQRMADTTPLLWTEAEMGTRYHLVFERDGYDTLNKEVVVNDHEEKVLVVMDRVSETVVLVIDSNPQKAEIVLDGKSYGLTPRRISGLDPASAATLELRLAGYETHRQELDWNERELEFVVAMRKK